MEMRFCSNLVCTEPLNMLAIEKPAQVAVKLAVKLALQQTSQESPID